MPGISVADRRPGGEGFRPPPPRLPDRPRRDSFAADGRTGEREFDEEERFRRPRRSVGEGPRPSSTRRVGERLSRREGERLPRLTGERPTRLTGERLVRLTGERLTRLTGERLARLTGERLARLTGERLVRLTGERLTRLAGERLPRRFSGEGLVRRRRARRLPLRDLSAASFRLSGFFASGGGGGRS
jgi:hypothetical protein